MAQHGVTLITRGDDEITPVTILRHRESVAVVGKSKGPVRSITGAGVGMTLADLVDFWLYCRWE
jgi:hypothetical protein